MGRVLLRVCVVVVIGAFLLATTARVRLWANGERVLWADAVRHAPDKPRPWMNLGRQYALDGADTLALWAYSEAVTRTQRPERGPDERGPDRAVAELNLAIVRAQAGDLAGALALTTNILAREPNAPFTQVLHHTWLNQQRSGVPSSY